ncbi:MAG: reverse transcriptase/maturase family protein [Wenzhouxiangellaceae bacterium]|nr:reverse transcriptase/maturase family protein [Wenzhouxiangellaceae bacterium]
MTATTVANPGSIKSYPHFDLPLSEDERMQIVGDPQRVAGNAFYPFLVKRVSWIPFRGQGDREPKVRLIRYASRRDAAIYAHYRSQLSERYESALADAGLGDCVLGYRRIPVRPGAAGGKCNIHFAKEAFEAIAQSGDCCAVVMDIASFFDNIDHARLKSAWCRLIGEQRLPPDHFAIFRSLTRHASVCRNEALERLGLAKRSRADRKLPIQLCSPEQFRLHIAGGDGRQPSLIRVNREPFGIPQGATISDLLANVYLMAFDQQMNEMVTRRGGLYRRYSDDLLIVVPGGADVGLELLQRTAEQLRPHGDQLRIHPNKSQVVAYSGRGDGCRVVEVATPRGRNGLEYLGFRFDGRYAYLRDATLSRLYRKMTHCCKREARRVQRQHPERDPHALLQAVNFQRLEARFGRVEDFEPGNVETWTFWTYARRADRILGALGKPVLGQVRNYRSFMQRTMRELLGA